MKRILFIIISILWIVIFSFPFDGKPKLGNLLNYSSGMFQIKPPELGANQIELIHDKYSGSILIDSLGIPHIFSETEESASFLLGYMHARDRLFQMELMIRMMQARLSELVGKKAEPLDDYWINFQFENQAKTYFREIKEKYAKEATRLEAYSNGVNYYQTNMPYAEKAEEYFLLDMEPRKWKPYYTALMIKYMAKMLNHQKTDLYLQEVLNTLPKELINQFYPMQEAYLQSVIPEKTGKPIPENIKTQINNKFSYSMTESEIEKFENQSIIGSNNWLVSGEKSASGEAILSNDMHLKLTLPCSWYEVQIKTKTTHVYGLSIPGSPFVIAGFNSAIAWGMTNAHWDLVDYLKPDYIDKETIRYGKEKREIEFLVDTIFRKDGSFKIVEIKRIDRGPIIKIKGKEYIVDWTGNYESDEFLTFMKFEKASNWDEYKLALSYFSTPPQNFVYADTAGNIGLYTTGHMPIKKKTRERGVFRSSDTLAVFSGYLPYSELPHIYNPEKGFIASANQRQIYNSKHYFNWSTFSAPYRGKRISERLEKMNHIKVEDMKNIQSDLLDISARQLVPLIMSVLKDEKEFSALLKVFENWNYEMRKELVAPSLYMIFRNQLIKEFKEMVLKRMDILNPPDWVFISQFLENEVFTSVQNEKVTRHVLFKDALQNTIDELKAKLGDDISGWTYGRIHKAEFNHIMKLSSFSNPAFPSNGSKFTVNVARGTPVYHGSSERSIFHMTTPIEAQLMIAGGQSGRASSPNYKNQIENWKAVRTHKVQFVDNPIHLKHIKMEINIGRENE